ncbi:MAG: DUF4388 domain-containing protein [Actinomycetota bacterium]|nr:DUF4388 domain-containing protein [Actinomycetota bacterium]
MLEGTLDTFALPAVVRLVRDSGASGRLSIMAALGTGSLVIEDGRVIDALPAPGSDVVEGALSLFEHHNGTFSFRNEPVGERKMDLEVEELLKLVNERAAAWARIREVIPGEGPISVLPDRRLDGPVTVSAEAWRIAVLASGKTPAQLAQACGLSEFKACSVLLDLLQDGLIVSIAAPSNGTPSGNGTPSHVEHAKPRPVESVVEPLPVEPDLADDEEEVSVLPEDPDLDPEMLLRELGEEAPTRPGRRRR